MSFDFFTFCESLFSVVSGFLMSEPVIYFVGLWLVAVVLGLLSRYLLHT